MGIDAGGTTLVVARTVWGEARGGGVEGMISVANVIQNRVAHPTWWGSAPREVCLAPEQFSCWLPGADRDAMLAADWLTPGFAAALAIAEAVVGSAVSPLPRLVKNATSYYAASMTPPPAWAARMKFVAEIAGQRFYALPDAAV